MHQQTTVELPGIIDCFCWSHYTAERRLNNHGRVGVHQGAEAEGRQAQAGDGV